MKHLKNIIIIIIIAGALGGIGNYYMLPVGSHKDFTIFRSIILGIIAAGVLPLFLKLISSNLLDFKEEPYKNYIILISFCLLTGVFADVFLQGIYRKVFHEFEEKIEAQDRQLKNNQLKSKFFLDHIQNRSIKKPPILNNYRGNNKIKDSIKLDSNEVKMYNEILEASILVLNNNISISKKKSIDGLIEKGLIEIQTFDVEMWLQVK